MPEVFKPRENMKEIRPGAWECRDENGKLVCDGGPSIIWEDGDWEFWTITYGYHRLDGPAEARGGWWINNVNVTKKIKEFAQENNIDLDNLTDTDKVMITLRFS